MVSLDDLFLLPGPPPSSLSPGRLPGVSTESGVAVTKLLKEDFEAWHAFFNDQGFHNHVSHHLLAIYQLGAGPALLEAAYKVAAAIQLPAFSSPEPITKANLHAHLGDHRFYSAYVQFFAALVKEKGALAVVEEFVFSAKYNIVAPAQDTQPMMMLDRFLAGVLHPIIFAGYGFEFGLPGMVVEGLAQTAIHESIASVFTPASLFKDAQQSVADGVNDGITRITELLPGLVLNKVSSKQSKRPDVHALTIVSQLIHDPYFSPEAIGIPTNEGVGITNHERVLSTRGERLQAIVDTWTVDGSNAEEVAQKIEELIWVYVLMYAVSGWGGRKHTENGKFNADFFIMHLVTSSIFLHSFAAYLSPTSISALLRAYMSNCLALWLARGRPALPIREFYASVSAHPVEHGAPHGKSGDGTLTPEDPSPNPWLSIVQTTLAHPNEHLCKLQRALAHYAVLYGTRPKGFLAYLAQVEGAPLEGAEEVDGTLFLRAAGLTADRLGWMREGEVHAGANTWDFAGFFD